MARIPSYGQIISRPCRFHQATLHPAAPLTRHVARRERSHPKVVLTAQTNAVALDLLENGIRQLQTSRQRPGDKKQADKRQGKETNFTAPCRSASPDVWKAEKIFSLR